MERLAGLGIGVDLPDGWDGRIYRRANELAGERRALHAANFAMPPARGDYGSGVTELMEGDGVFVTLVEFSPENANTGLFRHQGLPEVTADAFVPGGMPRAIAGQAGAQFFFSLGERAFCLFVVLGSYAARADLVPQVEEVLKTLSVD
ncbi:MAG: hypothetical protein ACLGI2_15640 [Acidimicrobiia bacterium]